jgi:uncharacterized membrane protein
MIPESTTLVSEKHSVPAHVAETLETIAELHKRAERAVPRHQRSIEASTAVLSRPSTVYVIAGAAVAWVALNLLLPRLGMQSPDPPPFNLLQVASGLGALLMATMVLSTQNRQRKAAEERERLDLHVNLLAEQKLAKVIALIEELRRDMPNVNNRVDSLAEAMTHAVDPNAVTDALKHNLEESLDSSGAKVEPVRESGEPNDHPPA